MAHKLSKEELYKVYLFCSLEERAEKVIINPDLVDDLYVGLCGAPATSPMSYFTESHGIEYKPENIALILLELNQLIEFKISYELFLLLEEDKILEFIKKKSLLSTGERLQTIKDNLAKNYFNSQEYKNKKH